MKPLHKLTFLTVFTAIAAAAWLLGLAPNETLAATALTPAAVDEEAMKEIRGGLEEFNKALEGKATKEEIQKALDAIEAIKTENEQLQRALNDNAQIIKAMGQGRTPNYNPVKHGGKFSEGCARWLGSIHALTAAQAGKSIPESTVTWARSYIEREAPKFFNDSNGRDIAGCAKGWTGKDFANANVKASLTTSEIPLPVDYQSEIFHLVENLGTYRRYARVFPMGAGDVKLKKTNARPNFSFFDMSGTVSEVAPSLSDVDLSAKKAGGIVVVPTEIDEDSIVAMGQFLGEYIAEEVAQWEDTTGWNADGSGTYKTLKGVTDKVKADENNKIVTLGSGLTASDDVTLASLRLVRGKTSAGVYRQDPAYYMHSSMEALLSTFNTGGTSPWNPERMTLDGFPVRWVDALSAYSSTAIASTVAVLWGSMRYWILGTRGGLRIDSSLHHKFATDETAIRALWRFSVVDVNDSAMAGVITAAS